MKETYDIMNDEIKEILDRLKYIVFNEIIDYGEELSLNECKLLLDYITNLQQANKSLTEQLEYLRSGEYLNQVKWERDLNENLNQTMSIELINYKSRCEKAIEYIKSGKTFDNEVIRKVVDKIQNDLLNILQNGSDSQ